MFAIVHQCRYEVIRTMRNRQSTIFTILMPLIFYFVFIQVNGANMKLEDTTWKSYFLMSMAAFSVVGSCMFGLSGKISSERTQGWLRLIQTTPMSHGSYLVIKCLSQFAVSFLSIAVLFVVGGVSQGVHLTVGQWIFSLLWLTIGSLPFLTLGLLIGVLCSTEATYIVCNILNFGLGILGGLWFPVAIMPHLMKDISAWTPTYRFAHVAWDNIAGRGMHWGDLGVMAGYAVLFIALTIWAMHRQEEHDA